MKKSGNNGIRQTIFVRTLEILYEKVRQPNNLFDTTDQRTT